MLSICIICYRKSWIEWAIYQVNKQLDYLKKNAKGLPIEILVDTPYPEVFEKMNNDNVIIYDSNMHSRIGSKRNLLCKKAKGSVIAMMDDDDYYDESRICYQLSEMKRSGYECSLAKDVLTMAIDNLQLYYCAEDSISESCLVFTKEFFKEKHFGTKINEGSPFLKNRMDDVLFLKNDGMIIALNHDDNTCLRTDEKILKSKKTTYCPNTDFLDQNEYTLLYRIKNKKSCYN